MLANISSNIFEKIVTQVGQNLGENLVLKQVEPVFGGDINSSFQVHVSGAETFKLFIKVNHLQYHSMFLAERFALELIGEKACIRVPKVYMDGRVDEFCFLAMEYIEIVNHGDSRALGAALATLHQNTSEAHGWEHNNFIGSEVQVNQWEKSWCKFWCELRLLPQIEKALRAHSSSNFERLCNDLLKAVPDILGSHAPKASLLHGDLWGGNKGFCADGSPIIFDPASYFGDRETDLAMTHLFGGFEQSFYDAYDEVWPLSPGHRQRRKLYNLYHLLNHLNIFGVSYLEQCRRTMFDLLA